MASKTEENRDLVKRYCEVGIQELLKGNRDHMHDYVADHFVQHTSSHDQHGKKGREDYKVSMEEAQRAIPDLRFSVERYVADGDYVVTHWRIDGKHEGRHKHRHADEHLEGTGADADIRGMTMYRVENGKIAESWMYDTHLDFLIEAGALKISRK
jgi:predicted ester cyclase